MRGWTSSHTACIRRSTRPLTWEFRSTARDHFRAVTSPGFQTQVIILSIQSYIAFAGIGAHTAQWTHAANSTEASTHRIPDIARRIFPGQPDEVTSRSSFKLSLCIGFTFEYEFLGDDDIGFHLHNSNDIVVGAHDSNR